MADLAIVVADLAILVAMSRSVTVYCICRQTLRVDTIHWNDYQPVYACSSFFLPPGDVWYWYRNRGKPMQEVMVS